MILAELRQDNAELIVPFGDRRYKVVPVSAGDGITLLQIFNAVHNGIPSDTAKQMSDVDICRLALGPVYDEMLDRETFVDLIKAGFTAWYWQLRLYAFAEAYWADGADQGKAPEPSSLDETSTDEASTTRSQASGSTTSTPRKKPAKKAQASRGRSSSRTGGS